MSSLQKKLKKIAKLRQRQPTDPAVGQFWTHNLYEDALYILVAGIDALHVYNYVDGKVSSDSQLMHSILAIDQNSDLVTISADELKTQWSLIESDGK